MQLKRNKDLEFETLKKSHKKQIIIGALAISIIGGALTFNLTRAKYKLTQDIPLVRGTVNYKVPDMRVVALYTQNDSGDYTEANNVPTSGYTLNPEKSVCKVYDGTTTIENAPKDNNVTIEYKDGAVKFVNITKKNTRCYLYFDKELTASETILANVIVNKTTPDFSQVSTKDEGVFKASDGMYEGTSYYWRGAVTNNYVKFANFCWRIIRINGDSTLRLIYDGTTCHKNGTGTSESIAKTNQAYNSSYNRSEYVGWSYSTGSQRTLNGTASNAKTQTENWYSSNITGTNASKVAQGKYCNDRNTTSGHIWSSQPSSTFYYAAIGRLQLAKAPSLSCDSGDVYTLNVGLITADEVAYAGGVYGSGNNNDNYYLCNGHNYWTMSPFLWYHSSSSNYARVFAVLNIGQLDAMQVNATYGLRPVINLKADVTFKPGSDGTLNNPYVVN